MTERLIVTNFLCLQDIDIEIKDFLILIGPQAAGKSLCAKLLYFFRTIVDEITLFYMKDAFAELSGFDMILSGKFESFFPKPYWTEQDFYIAYQRNQKTFCEIRKEKNQNVNLSIYLGQKAQAAVSETKQIFQGVIKPNDNPEKNEKNFKILLILPIFMWKNRRPTFFRMRRNK